MGYPTPEEFRKGLLTVMRHPAAYKPDLLIKKSHQFNGYDQTKRREIGILDF